MENIHILKNCPWITEEPVNLKDYFDKYSFMLNNACGRPRHEKVSHEEAMLQFFPSVSKDEFIAGSKKAENNDLMPDIENEDMRASPSNAAFDLDQMNKDCSIDLLTVDDEFPVDDGYISTQAVRHSGSLANWFTGKFEDGIIPPTGLQKLQTLQEQAFELQQRDEVRDYSRLRYRRLKYFSTLRMITDENNLPEPIKQKDPSLSSLEDIVLNVRIQRPFHKKTYSKKALCKFPSHSQELLLLGSQKLTELRDVLMCINDLAVNQDFSVDPQIYHLSHVHNNSVLYPAGFFYINGVFYNDTRNPEAKLYSENIINWSKKHPEIGEMKVKVMDETKFIDLELRLGYPYVYMHQGNCEHIITFTDVRLHQSKDPKDPAKYPLLRGQASKLAVKCCICILHLANWIVINEPRIPEPTAHLCDRCLKQLCYNDRGTKIHPNLQVYPFIDEFLCKQKKPFKT